MKTFLALLTGGGLAVAGGLLSGLLTNWLGGRRDHRKYDHERDMAREARRQDRLAQTYIELHRYLSHYWDWARSVRPLWGPIPAPERLPREERWRIEALVTAYGSEEVRQLLDEWGEHAATIENADQMMRLVEESKNPSAQLDEEAQREHRALRDYKEAMHAADETIRERVRRELRGEV
jgi:hypothetical protein